MPFTTRIVWFNELETLEKMSAGGMSLTSIAEHYSVSKQRIKQVFQKYKIPQVGLTLKKKEAQKRWNLKWGAKTDTGLYDAQRSKFRNKKSQALAKGVEFSVHFGELDWKTHCPVLGIELNYFAEKTEEESPSFDRVDCTKGYVAGNVQIISWRANRIKNDGSAEEHRKIADFIEKCQDLTF